MAEKREDVHQTPPTKTRNNTTTNEKEVMLLPALSDRKVTGLRVRMNRPNTLAIYSTVHLTVSLCGHDYRAKGDTTRLAGGWLRLKQAIMPALTVK